MRSLSDIERVKETDCYDREIRDAFLTAGDCGGRLLVLETLASFIEAKTRDRFHAH